MGEVHAVEAAAITWRPLGRLLVEQGLLRDDELELALAEQQVTGKRLGETIVESSFVSRPDLSNALAAQYGMELTTESGFGTGLRAQIQQRHETNRERAVPGEATVREEPAAAADVAPPAETVLVELLEEQWAELAAAEAHLADLLEGQWATLATAEPQLAELEAELAALRADRDRLRAQAERFARRARSARA
jgi:uncharacterized coiled-coil protein SlyX